MLILMKTYCHTYGRSTSKDKWNTNYILSIFIIIQKLKLYTANDRSTPLIARLPDSKLPLCCPCLFSHQIAIKCVEMLVIMLPSEASAILFFHKILQHSIQTHCPSYTNSQKQSQNTSTTGWPFWLHSLFYGTRDPANSTNNTLQATAATKLSNTTQYCIHKHTVDFGDWAHGRKMRISPLLMQRCHVSWVG